MNPQETCEAVNQTATGRQPCLSNGDRRDFLMSLGASGALALSAHPAFASLGVASDAERSREPAVVYGAFIYPPTDQLQADGYYSWPGSTFDAEGRQRQYGAALREAEARIGLRLRFPGLPLDTARQVEEFVHRVKRDRPDGLLLIPFKKGHWPHVTRIVDQCATPSVILASMGVLLVPQVRQIYREWGVFMVNSVDSLEAVVFGLKMIRTAKRMRQSRIVNIQDDPRDDFLVPHLGTAVRTVPRRRFVDEFDRLEESKEANRRAQRYLGQSLDIIEPRRTDVLDAAKTYFVLKRIVEQEQADAVMMECLPGLKTPHLHVPPCMGFMDLRDEGTPAGCEADLDATLTMMLVQNLFELPSFQHNPSVDTEKNLYFGAHCTCATRMDGTDEAAAPYVLRSHAEAGWGCVPQVALRAGQPVTMAKYLSNETQPRMILYTGRIVQSPCHRQTGGCRTNMITTIKELEDVCQLKGHHLSMWYGDWGGRMKAFNQLMNIETVT